MVVDEDLWFLRQDYAGFRKFEGPGAEIILEKVRDSLKHGAPVTEDEIRRVVEGLLMTNEAELALFYTLQDKLCKRCGDCCRIICSPICFSKTELKNAANYLGLEYKKLKRRVRAMPKGNGCFDVLGKPCPFLKGRNICTIYEVRPFVCRVYPAGATIAKGVMPSDCPIGNEVLFITALSRVSQLMISRSDPDLRNQIEAFQKAVWEPVARLPTHAQRMQEAIRVTKALVEKIPREKVN